MDANVFGRPTTDAVAANVLRNATLNATPSPKDPLGLPADDLAKRYARLLFALYDVRKIDVNPQRLAELQPCIDFAQRVYAQLHQDDDSAGPPAPNAQQAPPGMPDAGSVLAGAGAANPGSTGPQVPGAPPAAMPA